MRCLSLEAGDYLLVSIIDEGSGIPVESLDKIFDPYFTTKESGSGLGLTTLYSIVRKHHGQVLVSSRVGSRDCFPHLPSRVSRAAEVCSNSGRAQHYLPFPSRGRSFW